MKLKIILLIWWLLTIDSRIGLAQAPEGDTLTNTIAAFSALSPGEKDMLLSSTGVSDVSGMSAANIIGAFIFSGVGFVAFMYGKKERSYKPLVVGIVLMAYPYFLKSTAWIYVIGVGLCLLLYFWRD